MKLIHRIVTEQLHTHTYIRIVSYINDFRLRASERLVKSNETMTMIGGAMARHRPRGTHCCCGGNVDHVDHAAGWAQ